MLSNLPAPRIIERPHVRDRLLAALEKSHLLLVAPGGYSKSTVLRDLARHRPDARLVTITPADLDLAVLQARLEPLFGRLGPAYAR